MLTRYLVDRNGVRWSVRPIAVRHPFAPTSVRDLTREESLAFRSDHELRRITPAPGGWQALSDEALEALLARAEVIDG